MPLGTVLALSWCVEVSLQGKPIILTSAFPDSVMSGVGALWYCVSLVCGAKGGCAGGYVQLKTVLALSWCVEVSLQGKHIITLVDG